MDCMHLNPKGGRQKPRTRNIPEKDLGRKSDKTVAVQGAIWKYAIAFDTWGWLKWLRVWTLDDFLKQWTLSYGAVCVGGVSFLAPADSGGKKKGVCFCCGNSQARSKSLQKSLTFIKSLPKAKSVCRVIRLKVLIFYGFKIIWCK